MWILVLVALAGTAAAQKGKPSARAIDPFDAVLAETRGAPPEIAATTLRLLLETPRLTSLRRSEIVEALLLASDLVGDRYPQQFFANPANSQELLAFSRLPVDRLSIRCLVIRNLASRDLALTRRVIGESLPSSIPRATCRSPLLSNPTEFYVTISGVLKDLFTPEDRHLARDVQFVMDLITRAESSTQLPGLIDLIRHFETDAAQKRLLCSALAAKLGEIRDGDPAFTFAAVGGVGVKMRDLMRSSDLAAINPELLASYRNYLVANSQAERCAGRLFRSTGTPWDWFAQFNDLVGEFGTQAARIATLTDKETTTRKPSASATQTPAFADGPSLRLLEQQRRLGFAADGTGLGMAERQSAEWANSARAALSDLEAWRSGDDEAQFFREKARFYGQLLVMSRANDSVIESVVISFVAFLASSPAARTSAGEWLACGLRLLESDSSAVDLFSDDERERREAGEIVGPRLRPIVLKAFLASGSPELRLLARASQLANPPL
ncbi:MAG: hypothetical protein ABI823_12395 [Bryobacteraceae bacterium]